MRSKSDTSWRSRHQGPMLGGLCECVRTVTAVVFLLYPQAVPPHQFSGTWSAHLSPRHLTHLFSGTWEAPKPGSLSGPTDRAGVLSAYTCPVRPHPPICAWGWKLVSGSGCGCLHVGVWHPSTVRPSWESALYPLSSVTLVDECKSLSQSCSFA